MKGILTFLFVLFVLGLAFVIGSQNESQVTVNYLIAQAHVSVSTLIAICLLIGITLGVVIMLATWLRLRVQLLAANAKINRIQKD